MPSYPQSQYTHISEITIVKYCGYNELENNKTKQNKKLNLFKLRFQISKYFKHLKIILSYTIETC